MLIRRRHLITNALATAMIGATGLRASADEPTMPWPSVAKLINGYIEQRRYAGVTTVIGSGDAPPSYMNAGTLAFDGQAIVTNDSIFRLYSVTKAFTAVLTLIMVENGKLRLDQPVAEILPELSQSAVATEPKISLAARPATGTMTIEHLLTHTSGLSNWQPFLGDNPVSNAYRRNGLTPGAYGAHKRRPGYGPQVQGLDALIAGLAELPLIAEPGTAWNYSIGYDVLGAVIERVTGKSFATVMHDYIIAPLNMHSSGFQVPTLQLSRLTTLYGRTGDETYVIDAPATSDFARPPGLVAGGGGLVSTARDMARFADMLLNEGLSDGRRIAKAETINQAIQLFSVQRAAQSIMPGKIILSAVGASSTILHVDRERRMFAVFLAQLNRTGSPAAATTYRPELLAAIEADLAR